MPGIGNAIGWLFDLFGSKAERRRNKIEALEREQDELKTRNKTAKRDSRLVAIANELSQLSKEASNA